MEIGSEFWKVPISDRNSDFFCQVEQWFVSGRSALKSIILELHGCRTVAMPSWCCESMIKPFVEAGFDVSFYPVYWQSGLIQEINMKCDVLYIMDYFGYTYKWPDLKKYKGIIIRDVTHSVFSSVYTDADYYFGSLRKWCGVWTGGFAWSNDGHSLSSGKTNDCGYVNLRKEAMKQKEEYINGRRNDKGYLSIFNEAEEILEQLDVVSASIRDINIVKQIDVNFIRSQRLKNSKILRDEFYEWLVIPKMSSADCPLFVPVIVPNGKRDELRNFLIRKKIYCPVHWPVSKYHKLDRLTKLIYENELSLVCDQRYTECDMRMMASVIKEFMMK